MIDALEAIAWAFISNRWRLRAGCVRPALGGSKRVRMAKKDVPEEGVGPWPSAARPAIDPIQYNGYADPQPAGQTDARPPGSMTVTEPTPWPDERASARYRDWCMAISLVLSRSPWSNHRRRHTERVERIGASNTRTDTHTRSCSAAPETLRPFTATHRARPAIAIPIRRLVAQGQSGYVAIAVSAAPKGGRCPAAAAMCYVSERTPIAHRRARRAVSMWVDLAPRSTKAFSCSLEDLHVVRRTLTR